MAESTLLGELLAEYEQQASGSGKAAGRAALYKGLIPSVRETIGRLEDGLVASRKEITAGC